MILFQGSMTLLGKNPRSGQRKVGYFSGSPRKQSVFCRPLKYSQFRHYKTEFFRDLWRPREFSIQKTFYNFHSGHFEVKIPIIKRFSCCSFFVVLLCGFIVVFSLVCCSFFVILLILYNLYKQFLRVSISKPRKMKNKLRTIPASE